MTRTDLINIINTDNFSKFTKSTSFYYSYIYNSTNYKIYFNLGIYLNEILVNHKKYDLWR